MLKFVLKTRGNIGYQKIILSYVFVYFQSFQSYIDGIGYYSRRNFANTRLFNQSSIDYIEWNFKATFKNLEFHHFR